MPGPNRDSPEATFLAALAPVVEALGASLIEPGAAHPGDHAVTWADDTVAFVRAGELHGALERTVAAVEREIGSPLAEMDRAGKQKAVRRLDEQGAFLLRGAVETVAGWMDVSKVTLYTYLNVIDRTTSRETD